MLDRRPHPVTAPICAAQGPAPADPSAVILPAFAAPLLETRNLTFAAAHQRLIDGVRLTVRQGRCLALMGANGSGKSLCLRLMHGLIAPTEGDVLWRGRPLDAAARREQLLVFQRPVMLRRSAIANVRFALGVRGVPRRHRRALAAGALHSAGLSHVAGRPARLLSGGEQQRLALARALVCEPKLLLLDEPTASLDPASTEAIETLLREAHARGTTIVIVTHDRGQARRLADDVAFLCDGRLVEHGPAAKVLSAPRSEAARAWLDGRLYVGSRGGSIGAGREPDGAAGSRDGTDETQTY